MPRIVCVLFLASGLIAMACGCGGSSVPKLEPEVAKKRQEKYESRMTDGPARGAVKSKNN